MDFGTPDARGYYPRHMTAHASEPCWWCKMRRATEWHHIILHRRRGDQGRNHPYNLAHVCHECHESGALNDYEARLRWWTYVSRKYGGVNVMTWYLSVPIKGTRERYSG